MKRILNCDEQPYFHARCGDIKKLCRYCHKCKKRSKANCEECDHRCNKCEADCKRCHLACDNRRENYENLVS